mmetsp:Transcript_25244/g.74227  ORF Transcript_25244/g.74227 Transcript_25244/m.74227 type:complete len:205 (-) Transcript_25244:301-915(-)
MNLGDGRLVSQILHPQGRRRISISTAHPVLGPFHTLQFLPPRTTLRPPPHGRIDDDGRARQPSIHDPFGAQIIATRQVGMQIERSTGEMPYGTVIVPIEGEESTRLPGRGGGDLAGRIDEYRSNILIAGEVIRRGRTDDAGSGYDDGPFFLFGGGGADSSAATSSAEEDEEDMVGNTIEDCRGIIIDFGTKSEVGGRANARRSS